MLLPRSKLAELVDANLRDGVRRTAATAAPIVLLVGLVVGLAGAVEVIDAGRRAELERTVRGNVVVLASAPIGDRIAAMRGVRAVSEEAALLIEMPDAESEYSTVDALAVDRRAYPVAHTLTTRAALASLSGDAVALDRSYAAALHTRVGRVLPARLDGTVHPLLVAAILPESMTGPEAMLSLELADGIASEWRYVIDAGDQAASVARRIAALGAPGASRSPIISVSGVDEWIGLETAARRAVSQNIILAILGLATLYIAIAVANAVVIAAADRRREFATVRLTGLTRGQVVRAALWESLVVAAIGIALGGAAAAITLAGVAAGVSDVVGTRIVAIPWTLIGVTVAGAAALVAVTSTLTAAAATREPAITLAGVRE